MFAPRVARTPTKTTAASASKTASHRWTLQTHRPSNRTTGPGVAWDFRAIPIFPARAVIQPKLSVGSVDDAFEREADHVAAEVMRMPAPASLTRNAPLQLSRKCAACTGGSAEGASDVVGHGGRARDRARGIAARPGSLSIPQRARSSSPASDTTSAASACTSTPRPRDRHARSEPSATRRPTILSLARVPGSTRLRATRFWPTNSRTWFSREPRRSKVERWAAAHQRRPRAPARSPRLGFKDRMMGRAI